MSELFRDTVAGQLLRLCSGNQILRYPEEVEGVVFHGYLSKPSSARESENDDLPTLNWTRSRDAPSEKYSGEEVITWSGPNDPAVGTIDDLCRARSNLRC